MTHLFLKCFYCALLRVGDETETAVIAEDNLKSCWQNGEVLNSLLIQQFQIGCDGPDGAASATVET